MTHLTQIGPVTYGTPVQGIAPILAVCDADGNEVIDRGLLAKGNSRVQAVGAFRLEHARQTDYPKYLKICAARQITPDPTSPAPSHYTGSFKDWPVN